MKNANVIFSIALLSELLCKRSLQRSFCTSWVQIVANCYTSEPLSMAIYFISSISFLMLPDTCNVVIITVITRCYCELVYDLYLCVPARYPNYDVLGDPSLSKSAGLSSRYSEDSLRGVIIDIYLLSLTDYLVCTFSSQASHLSLLLHFW